MKILAGQDVIDHVATLPDDALVTVTGTWRPSASCLMTYYARTVLGLTGEVSSGFGEILVYNKKVYGLDDLGKEIVRGFDASGFYDQETEEYHVTARQLREKLPEFFGPKQEG